MLNHSPRPTRHALDLLPTHIRGNSFNDPTFGLKPRIRRARKFDARARGCGIFYIVKKRNQRCVIKISYTKNTKTRSWAAHGEYLQREHAQQESEKGLGFNNHSDNVDLKTTLCEWQHSNDAHVFRLIISPENGYRMDLKKHAKDLLQQMEKDLKTKLQWAAIDHHNTDYPHLHVLIRGRDDHNKTLVIESEYLSRTLRHQSEEFATRELGLRKEHDLVRAREKQLDREYVTEIDRSLRYKAVNSIVNYHTPVPDNLAARELRLLEIKRLKFLEILGLVEKISAKSWKLNDELEPVLQKMQLSNDIIKSQARHNIRTFSPEEPTPTHIQENKPLTGKVVGMGLENELKDQRYLLLEGIDGKVHYIQASNSIIKARDNFKFYNENLITLEKKKFTNEHGKIIEYHRVTNHINLREMQKDPLSRLDRDVIEFVKSNGTNPVSHFHEQSFAHEYATVMTKRFHELERGNIFINKKGHYELASDWQKKIERLIQQRQQTQQIELQRKHGHVTKNEIALEHTQQR